MENILWRCVYVFWIDQPGSRIYQVFHVVDHTSLHEGMTNAVVLQQNQ